jgi:hypothetical protein
MLIACSLKSGVIPANLWSRPAQARTPNAIPITALQIMFFAAEWFA